MFNFVEKLKGFLGEVNPKIINEEKSQGVAIAIDPPKLELPENSGVENFSPPSLKKEALEKAPSPIQRDRILLQEQLDATGVGETLPIFPPNGEYQGPIAIDRPLILDGNGATIWSRSGPVASVETDGVTLRNLRIEATGESPQHPWAIWVKQGCNVKFEEVEVRGTVRGIDGEEGVWHYPQSLDLGQLAYGVEREFLLRIIVPIACQIADNISGLEFSPRYLHPGANEIRVHLEKVPKDTLIYGCVFLVSESFKRRIALTALVGSYSQSDSPSTQVAWEAPEWQQYQKEKEENSLPRSPIPRKTIPQPKNTESWHKISPPQPPMVRKLQSSKIKRDQKPISLSWSMSPEEEKETAPRSQRDPLRGAQRSCGSARSHPQKSLPVASELSDSLFATPKAAEAAETTDSTTELNSPPISIPKLFWED